MERIKKREGKERVENYKYVATALKKRSDVSIGR